MELYELQRDIREKVKSAAEEMFGIDLDQVTVEFPPKTEMGDLAFPIQVAILLSEPGRDFTDL